ncbi:MAG: leucine-rich repeat protein, partial [Micrococcales bacterium]
ITELTIPGSVTTIGDRAFKGNPISRLTLNEGLTSIGIQSFSEMYGTSDVDITLPNSLTSLAQNAFDQSKFGAVVIGNGLTTIPYSAFYNNYGFGVTSITFGSAVTTIDVGAFIGYRGTNLVIPEGITTIDTRAFEGGATLERVSLPNSLTTLGQIVFNARPTIPTLSYCGSDTTVLNYADYPGSSSIGCYVSTRYMANGGIGTSVNDYTLKNTTGTVRNNPYIRFDAQFSGWNSLADGTGTSYTAGAALTYTGDKTLYAQWAPLSNTAPITKTVTWNCSTQKTGQSVFVPVLAGRVSVNTTNCDHIELFGADAGANITVHDSWINSTTPLPVKVYAAPFTQGDSPVATLNILVADPTLTQRDVTVPISSFGWGQAGSHDYGQVPAQVNPETGSFAIVPAAATEPQPAASYEWEGGGMDGSTGLTWLLSGRGCELWNLNTTTGATTQRFLLPTSTGLALTYCTGMLVNQDGTAIIGASDASDNMIIKVSLATGALVPGFTTRITPGISGIAKDPTTGNIWASVTGGIMSPGLYRLDLATGVLTNRIAISDIWDIAFDSLGTLWLADWGSTTGLDCGNGCYSYISPNASNPLATLGSLGTTYDSVNQKYHTTDALWFAVASVQSNVPASLPTTVITNRKHKVTFVTNFSTGAGTSSQLVSEAKFVGQPSTPSLQGYSFVGWRLGSPTGPVVEPEKVRITEDQSFYAAWKRNIYSVRLLTGSSATSSVQQVAYQDRVAFGKTPTKKGYLFKGWRIGSSTGPKFSALTRV